MRILQNADCLLLPSYNEGKPLIILEAMSVGTPIISSNVGYINELFFENYPFLFKSNDIEDFLKCCNKFIQLDKTDFLNLTNKLYNHFINNFSIKLHEIKLLELFKI
jgi:glycosyltransferase involved in cell wall biosynthesis